MKNQLSAIKALFRFRIYTIINIIGLAISVAATLIIVRYIHQEVTVDHFCKDLNQLYILTAQRSNGHISIIDNTDRNNDPNFIDKMGAVAKQATDKFQLNANIKKELDFYKVKGKVLGIVPQTKFLKIDQELNDMDPAELVEHRIAAQKNKNKVKEPKNDNEKARLENWSYREKKATELLDTKFKK